MVGLKLNHVSKRGHSSVMQNLFLYATMGGLIICFSDSAPRYTKLSKKALLKMAAIFSEIGRENVIKMTSHDRWKGSHYIDHWVDCQRFIHVKNKNIKVLHYVPLMLGINRCAKCQHCGECVRVMTSSCDGFPPTILRISLYSTHHPHHKSVSKKWVNKEWVLYKNITFAAFPVVSYHVIRHAMLSFHKTSVLFSPINWPTFAFPLPECHTFWVHNSSMTSSMYYKVCPLRYTHGLVVLCFVVAASCVTIGLDSSDRLTDFRQGCFTGTG